MDNKIVEQIKKLYEEVPNDYKRNDKYSSHDVTVFTKTDKPDNWLSISQKDKGLYMATRTDTSGFITNREMYSVDDGEVSCISREVMQSSLKRRLAKAKERTKRNCLVQGNLKFQKERSR